MPKTFQIRDVDDDDLYAELKRRVESGASVPDWVREELARIAEQPTMEEWLERVGRHRTPYKGTEADIIEALDEIRGPWPDADH